jgi:methylmalonyl-CoA mutase
MTDLSAGHQPVEYKAKNKIRFVTAASLFDGHDASINIMRRILQTTGVEVIHLGHNRSVEEIVNAALQEDVQGVAVSSYQGGHLEFFKYMLDLLRSRGGENIKVFGGGGGVIVADEVRELQAYGVSCIYTPEDGQKLGLQGMINDMVMRCDEDLSLHAPQDLKAVKAGDRRALARLITALESGSATPGLAKLREQLQKEAKAKTTPVLGITGTGGAGKSSLTDELIRRFRIDQGDRLDIAVLATDPSRRKSGGALLGDRIRMNAIEPWANGARVFMRSLATRDTGTEVSAALADAIAACRVAGFDLIVVETSGIGQGDAAIVPLVDVSLYVMTPEFGAASQLEKIDMLDFADFVAINKFDRRGAEDALRDVRKQVQRNRKRFAQGADEMPVYGTIASRFNDDGVTALYQGIAQRLAEDGMKFASGALPAVAVKASSGRNVVVPAARSRYLAEIADSVRDYKRHAAAQAKLARERQQLQAAKAMLLPLPSPAGRGAGGEGPVSVSLDSLIADRDTKLDARSKKLLDMWPRMQTAYAGDEYVVKIRDRELRTKLTHTTLSGSTIRKVALPRYEDAGELLRWLLLENVPGSFPFTAGVFAFKRENEDPTRMFAGEGDPFRTNRRFKYLSKDYEAKRLSTAFDSVTLYGFDPDTRPDIYGKVGNSGVSIATLDDLKVLYGGFDLCAPNNSVSMTINGPAPTILAMFMNAAVDQQVEKFRADNGREPTEDESDKIREWTLETVRGTVQADILKEDQGQNTCIFSTEFSLKVMGDIQEYFVHHEVKNFYSVSISGYHIAEAGANPISQLAFTMANGFTFVEAYLARGGKSGMHIDDFAPNLSFFFSSGMDPEYAVLGRVARRIWAVAMKHKYGANERSQKLKYHCQTSGRSLHAQEIAFNDIRTTLQALIATYDNANSLHTNAYDEAITTPTEESVRRAQAIQMVINREWGIAKNENPNQGAFIIDELTELVEEAVLKEFEAISERGGVLGAMETGYQRGKIQEESLHYEQMKHDGSYPIIGVNTFRNPHADPVPQKIELIRSTEEEKQSQLARLADFHQRHAAESGPMLDRLKRAVIADENVFAVLMDAVRCCSLGQITHALFEVGGQYRRSM